MKKLHKRSKRPHQDALVPVRSGDQLETDASPPSLLTVPPWIQRSDLWIQRNEDDGGSSRPKFLGMSTPERLALARFLKTL